MYFPLISNLTWLLISAPQKGGPSYGWRDLERRTTCVYAKSRLDIYCHYLTLFPSSYPDGPTQISTEFSESGVHLKLGLELIVVFTLILSHLVGYKPST